MECRVLTAHDVANILGISPMSVYRSVAKRRQGIDLLFPLPISSPGAKYRFFVEDIDRYLQILSQRNIISLHVSNPTKELKQAAKAYEERQKIARQKLEQYRKQRDEKK